MGRKGGRLRVEIESVHHLLNKIILKFVFCLENVTDIQVVDETHNRLRLYTKAGKSGAPSKVSLRTKQPTLKTCYPVVQLILTWHRC